MTIIFVSHLGEGLSAGPHWSVPARVMAQTKYDEVLWINTTNIFLPHYQESMVYHNLSEFDRFELECLPPPFNKPDCVVFEGFYSIKAASFAHQLKRRSIPYIITPRGSLTRQARHNASRFKKNIAHFLVFNRFQRNALAIQYLTKQEEQDSVSPCKNSYVLPNGFSSPQRIKSDFSQTEIKGLFIGRIDIYHKGLDTLVEAVKACRSMMNNYHFSIDIYGPINDEATRLQQMLVDNKLEEIITLKGEISGKEKERVILDADVFILPSRFEGHPMGLIEALAYGLPCVVTPGTNMKEDIDAADAGWTCDGTIASLEITLRRVMEDSVFYKTKSENAQKLAREYDWDKLALKFHDILQSIL